MKKEELQILKDLSEVELTEKLLNLREEQFNLRMRHKSGQLEQTSELRKVRRSIARIKQISSLNKISTNKV